MHKYKTYILLFSVIFSITLSIRTIKYKSDVPKKIGEAVDYYIERENINYIYTVLPPNVNFYIEGDITVPSTHPWFRIGTKLPMVLKNRMIIEKHKNPLLHEDKILLVHSTIFDTLKNNNPDLYDSSKVVEKIEFIDAPVYYKDIFNPLRETQQIYEFYIFPITEINNLPNKFWSYGFDKEVKVIYRKIK